MNDHYQQIKSTLIVGGTHGNELSGVQALNNWLKQSKCELAQIAPSTDIKLTLANKPSIQQRTRYVDEDLNRQFSPEKLVQNIDKTKDIVEAGIAHTFNHEFGPKFLLDKNMSGDTRTDFIIDIHNTTSNMGPTLIILVSDEFHQQLARFVKHHLPDSNILVEDYQAFDDFAYLCTVGKRGVMIEVGPQPQGTLRAKVYQQTVKMTELILRFIELHNTQAYMPLPAVEAYRLDKEVAYPTYEDGSKQAMIHPSLDAKDFCLLKKGEPCFVDFDGKDILWEEEDCYPHFIGEAAYDHLSLAFASAHKCMF